MTIATQLECDQSAIDHCREVTRREARNFYYGLRLLPEPQRSSLFCIYAWMRQADDLADDEAGLSNPDAAAENLDRFRLHTHQAIAGNLPSTDPMWRAFHAIVNHYQLDEKPFDEMTDGKGVFQFVQLNDGPAGRVRRWWPPGWPGASASGDTTRSPRPPLPISEGWHSSAEHFVMFGRHKWPSLSLSTCSNPAVSMCPLLEWSDPDR